MGIPWAKLTWCGSAHARRRSRTMSRTPDQRCLATPTGFDPGNVDGNVTRENLFSSLPWDNAGGFATPTPAPNEKKAAPLQLRAEVRFHGRDLEQACWVVTPKILTLKLFAAHGGGPADDVKGMPLQVILVHDRGEQVNSLHELMNCPYCEVQQDGVVGITERKQDKDSAVLATVPLVDGKINEFHVAPWALSHRTHCNSRFRILIRPALVEDRALHPQAATISDVFAAKTKAPHASGGHGAKPRVGTPSTSAKPTSKQNSKPAASAAKGTSTAPLTARPTLPKPKARHLQLPDATPAGPAIASGATTPARSSARTSRAHPYAGRTTRSRLPPPATPPPSSSSSTTTSTSTSTSLALPTAGAAATPAAESAPMAHPVAPRDSPIALAATEANSLALLAAPLEVGDLSSNSHDQDLLMGNVNMEVGTVEEAAAFLSEFSNDPEMALGGELSNDLSSPQEEDPEMALSSQEALGVSALDDPDMLALYAEVGEASGFAGL